VLFRQPAVVARGGEERGAGHRERRRRVLALRVPLRVALRKAAAQCRLRAGDNAAKVTVGREDATRAAQRLWCVLRMGKVPRVVAESASGAGVERWGR
jgi:hypothetical protein